MWSNTHVPPTWLHFCEPPSATCNVVASAKKYCSGLRLTLVPTAAPLTLFAWPAVSTMLAPTPGKTAAVVVPVGKVVPKV